MTAKDLVKFINWPYIPIGFFFTKHTLFIKFIVSHQEKNKMLTKFEYDKILFKWWNTHKEIFSLLCSWFKLSAQICICDKVGFVCIKRTLLSRIVAATQTQRRNKKNNGEVICDLCATKASSFQLCRKIHECECKWLQHPLLLMVSSVIENCHEKTNQTQQLNDKLFTVLPFEIYLTFLVFHNWKSFLFFCSLQLFWYAKRLCPVHHIFVPFTYIQIFVGWNVWNQFGFAHLSFLLNFLQFYYIFRYVCLCVFFFSFVFLNSQLEVYSLVSKCLYLWIWMTRSFYVCA